MAHKNDYQIQKQLDKPQTWFCKYYPARIRNVGEKEIADRQLVFDFKDGRKSLRGSGAAHRREYADTLRQGLREHRLRPRSGIHKREQRTPLQGFLPQGL